jgi:hypothetical protein
MANTTTTQPGRTDDSGESGGVSDNKVDAAKSAAGAVASSAKEQAGGVVAATGEQAREVMAQAQEQMSSTLSSATDQARKALKDTTSQAKSQADDRARQAAVSMREAGDQFRALAEGRVDEAGPMGDYAKLTAERLTGFAARVEEGGIEGLLKEMSRFARRRPGLFIMGAIATGFAAGRLAKHPPAAPTQNAGVQNAGIQNAGIQNAGYGATPDVTLGQGPGAVGG